MGEMPDVPKKEVPVKKVMLTSSNSDVMRYLDRIFNEIYSDVKIELVFEQSATMAGHNAICRDSIDLLIIVADASLDRAKWVSETVGTRPLCVPILIWYTCPSLVEDMGRLGIWFQGTKLRHMPLQEDVKKRMAAIHELLTT